MATSVVHLRNINQIAYKNSRTVARRMTNAKKRYARRITRKLKMKNARQRSCSTLANGSVKTRAREWTSGRRTRPMSNRVFEVGKPDRKVHDSVMADTPNPLLSSRRCERTPTLPLHCRRRTMRASYPDVVRFHPSRISAHSLEKEEKSFF